MPLRLASGKHILMTRFPYEAVLSGEEWHTILLAEALGKKGYGVRFMGSCPVLIPELKKRKFPVKKVWAGVLPVSKGALLSFLFTWPWILCSLWYHFIQMNRREKIDTVYMLSLTEKILLTPLLLLLRKKVLWVEHQRFGAWIYKNPLRMWYVFWSPFVKLIAVSPLYKKQIAALGIKESQIQCIVNGIETSFFAPEGEKWRPGASDEFRIGTVARLSEDKGVDLLLEAFAGIRKSMPEVNCTLYVFGEGPGKTQLLKQVERLEIGGHVHFCRPYVDAKREEMPDFYRSLSCFVLASRYLDPFGLVVAEAMASGVPTIVTRVCGVASFLSHGQDALVIPENSSAALEKALKTLIQEKDLQKLLKKEGREKAEREFSLARMVEEFSQLL